MNPKIHRAGSSEKRKTMSASIHWSFLSGAELPSNLKDLMVDNMSILFLQRMASTGSSQLSFTTSRHSLVLRTFEPLQVFSARSWRHSPCVRASDGRCFPACATTFRFRWCLSRPGRSYQPRISIFKSACRWIQWPYSILKANFLNFVRELWCKLFELWSQTLMLYQPTFCA